MNSIGIESFCSVRLDIFFSVSEFCGGPIWMIMGILAIYLRLESPEMFQKPCIISPSLSLNQNTPPISSDRLYRMSLHIFLYLKDGMYLI